MTSFSINRHNHLRALLHDGQLHPPRREGVPRVRLPAELACFEASPRSEVLVYRGDFTSCEEIGHFARIWTAAERGVFTTPLTCRSNYSTQRFVDRLQTFWSLGAGGKIEAACHEIARQIEAGPADFVDWLIDCHTDAEPWSPFVSATFDREFAARFAPGESMAVYECRLESRRCIIDAHNIGRTGASREILVLGWICKEETKLYVPGDDGAGH